MTLAGSTGGSGAAAELGLVLHIVEPRRRSRSTPCTRAWLGRAVLINPAALTHTSGGCAMPSGAGQAGR